MQNDKIHTIDLKFQGVPKTIGAFLILHSSGGALVECGPGSTLSTLIQGLADHQLSPQQITDVFLTHIHLDHAGSAGWWAKQGATIHVHELGAAHMLKPEKLLSSAGRIYGDMMDTLWGEFLPVGADKIRILTDNQEIRVGDRTIRALDTPGHANHHLSYFLDGVCFSGDVGGVHLQGIPAVRLPTVPPEFNPEKWRISIQRFRKENIEAFATTHYGIHEDAAWHLDAIEFALDQVENWMFENISMETTREEIRQRHSSWMEKVSAEAGLPDAIINAYEMAISSQMSADGIYRYWHKMQEL
jgi:glyoxylase-like metal-dependent hydrolase (beta-lactamase superfamily II)